MSDDIPRLIQRIERGVAHLKSVRARLLEGTREVTAEWVRTNADEPIFIDRLNSFGMQVGRTAESVTKKLLPQLLEYAGETVGSVIDNLNTAHKVGWIDDPAALVRLPVLLDTLLGARSPLNEGVVHDCETRQDRQGSLLGEAQDAGGAAAVAR